MKRLLTIGLVMIIAILSTGCATLYTGGKLNAGDSEIAVNLPPAMYAGVKMADYSKAQGFVVVLNNFLLYYEYHKFRVSWEIRSINKDGRLYDGVVITNLEEKSPNGLFYGHGKTFTPSRDARIIVLASNASMGFDAYGKPFVVFRDLLKSVEYRKELYAKGTPLSELPDAGGFEAIVSGWKHRFQTPFGLIHTPWPREIIFGLSKINTGYTASERAREGKWGIYINPALAIVNPMLAAAPTAIGLVKDIGRTAFGSSHGWDMDSEFEKEEKQISRMHLEDARENAVVRIYRKEMP